MQASNRKKNEKRRRQLAELTRLRTEITGCFASASVTPEPRSGAQDAIGDACDTRAATDRLTAKPSSSRT